MQKSGATTVGENTVTKYDINTWTTDEQTRVHDALVKRFGPDSEARVNAWLKDANSIAATILKSDGKLEFTPAEHQTFMKPNQEYRYTIDASTLCPKRLPYQGTFNAIQHMFPDHIFTSTELIELRNLMAEM